MPLKKAAASTRPTRDADTPSADEGNQKEQNGAEDTSHLWLLDPGDNIDPMSFEEFVEEIKDVRKSYQMLARLWNIVRVISTNATERDAIIAEKDARIEELQDISALATETIAKAKVKRSPMKSDPPMLTDGVDPTFEGWKIKMKYKLSENSDHFATEKSKGGAALFVPGKMGWNAVPQR